MNILKRNHVNYVMRIQSTGNRQQLFKLAYKLKYYSLLFWRVYIKINIKFCSFKKKNPMNLCRYPVLKWEKIQQDYTVNGNKRQ